MRPFLGYHFFHTVGKIPPREAFIRTQRAMQSFSDSPEPTRCGVMLNIANERQGPLEAVSRKLCDTYGPIDNTIKGIPVEGGLPYLAYQWHLKTAQLQQAFDLVEKSYRDIPPSREKLSVQAAWSFKFTNPQTGEVLPHQEALPTIDFRLGAGSSLGLTAGHKSMVNAWFLFPFDTASKEFESYAAAFQGLLIFKFLPKHWRIWKYSKGGEWRPRHFVPNLASSESE